MVTRQREHRWVGGGVAARRARDGAGAIDRLAPAGVDLYAVHHAAVYQLRLRLGHTRRPVTPGELTASRDVAVAMHTDPQHGQTIQQRANAPLRGCSTHNTSS